ncbi:MAG TPA: heparinase II/III family protein [Hyphomicrobiaceae bacterium]|nr:heparinase II/III family protein [Hyphomicrobiaceae bacterium]
MQNSSPEPAAAPEPSAWSRLGASLAAREKVERALLVVDRARVQMLAYVRRSQLLARAAPDELLMAPPDLRVPDPSFVDELRFGNFGLAGEIADLAGRSPFTHAVVSAAWARELHGFGWLRHLDAVRAEDTERLARRLLADWLQEGSRDKSFAWAPETTGRRLMSWLSHSQLLLDGADPRFYAAVLRSFERQASYLSAAWQDAPQGHDRLVALIGLVLADLCLAGHERPLKRSQKLLAAEIERQIFADGGHIGRNPQTSVELVLDLLPVRQCFLVRGLTPASALLRALAAMVPMLRHLRLGDGSLARFNGVGPTDRDALATVLAYDKNQTALPPLAPASGYARLERGPSIVVVDVGPPPPLSFAHSAHAGCLAFEASVGSEPLFVNNGAPASSDPGRRASARATASHNTLCIKEQSSSQLSRRGSLRGALAIEHPDHVSVRIAEAAGALELEASHDGYVGRWGLVHARSLSLAADGTKLSGSEALLPAKGVLRFAWDVPFAVHFHVHPDVEVWPGREPDTADLVLKSGAHWRLSAQGAQLTIETSMHSAGALGPLPAQQLVLRAACHGEAKVSWQLERMPPGCRPQHAASDATALARSLAERLALAATAVNATPDGPATAGPDQRGPDNPEAQPGPQE